MRLLAVLNVRFKYAWGAKRLAPRADGPLTHFSSPRGEKCRLAGERVANDLLVVAGDQMTVRIGGMGPIDGAEFAPAVHI